jgi:hypothetical protein
MIVGLSRSVRDALCFAHQTTNVAFELTFHQWLIAMDWSEYWRSARFPQRDLLSETSRGSHASR